MSDDIRASYHNTLRSNIAWNGHKLCDVASLVDDLTFRRVMTWAFSPAQPFDLRALERLIGKSGTANRSQFEELLDRAILKALGTGDFLGFVSESEKAAPTRLTGSNSRNDNRTTRDDDDELRLSKAQIWAARFIVFDQLIDDLDFQEYVLECDEHKGLWKKILDWGEHLRLPASPGRPEATKDRAQGTVWDGLFKPVLHSLVYVVPIAIGAGWVGTYVVERQSEVSLTTPTIENRLPPTAVTNIIPPTTIQNNLPPATIQNNLPPMTVENILPAQSFIAIQDGLGQTPTPNDASRCKSCTTSLQTTIHLTFDSDQWTQFSALMRELPPITVRLGNERTEKPENRDKNKDGAKPPSVGTGSATVAQNASGSAGGGVTQNTSAAEPDSQALQSPTATRLNLNLDLGELDVKQQLYPLEMVAPTHAVAARRPELIIVDERLRSAEVSIEKRIPADPSSKDADKAKESGGENKAFFYLCDWGVPVKFLVSSSKLNAPADCSSTKSSTSSPKLYVFTRTAQYVPEIDAYVSVDEASRRRFLLMGSRRIVLQVVPNVAEPGAKQSPNGTGF